MATPGASTPPNFLVENLEEGDKVVALRILPGVDVLENRWAAADKIFSDNGIEAVDYFTGADPAEIKKIVSDELRQGRRRRASGWTPATVPSRPSRPSRTPAPTYPVMTGEDEMSFLRKWEETGLTGLAPVYSNFQWRTPLLAAQKIFAGEEVPAEWVLPQTPITEEERGRLPGRQRGHARRSLRQVRRRGPARLPGGLAGASDPLT